MLSMRHGRRVRSGDVLGERAAPTSAIKLGGGEAGQAETRRRSLSTSQNLLRSFGFDIIENLKYRDHVIRFIFGGGLLEFR